MKNLSYILLTTICLALSSAPSSAAESTVAATSKDSSKLLAEQSKTLPKTTADNKYKSDIVSLDELDVILLYHQISGDKQVGMKRIVHLAESLKTPESKEISAVAKHLENAWKNNDEFELNDNMFKFRKLLAERAGRLTDAYFFSVVRTSAQKKFLEYDFNKKVMRSSLSFGGEVIEVGRDFPPSAWCVSYSQDLNICLNIINMTQATNFKLEPEVARKIHEAQKANNLSQRFIFKVERKLRTSRSGMNTAEHTLARAVLVRTDLIDKNTGLVVAYEIAKKDTMPKQDLLDLKLTEK